MLKTDFLDDILDPSMNNKRKYTITDAGSGKYEIEDATDYTQKGSNYGANQINTTNKAVNDVTEKAENNENDIKVLEERMNQFTSLPDGSTSGDAELTDIRVAFDGTTYPTAGEAVRGQMLKLNDEINNLGVSKYYPFSDKITDTSLFDLKAIINLKIYNADIKDEYVLAALRKNQVAIYKRDGDGFGEMVCESTVDYSESSLIENVVLKETNRSGIYAVVTIDWSKVDSGMTSMNWTKSLISKNCYSTDIYNEKVYKSAFLNEYATDFYTYYEGYNGKPALAGKNGKLYSQKDNNSAGKAMRNIGDCNGIRLSFIVDAKLLESGTSSVIVGLSEQDKTMDDYPREVDGFRFLSYNGTSYFCGFFDEIDSNRLYEKIDLNNDAKINVDICVTKKYISVHAVSNGKHICCYREKKNYKSIQVYIHDMRGIDGSCLENVSYTFDEKYVISDNVRCLINQGNHSLYRIYTPAKYNGSKINKAIICFHGSGSDEGKWDGSFGGDGNYKKIFDALLNNGYIVLTCVEFDGSNRLTTTWGNKKCCQAYYEAYKFLIDNYNIGKVGIFANSMGGIESLNTMANKNIDICCWVGTSPSYNLRSCYDGNFKEAIDYSYEIKGDDYSDKTKFFDPALMEYTKFKNIPMYVLTGNNDEQLDYLQNAKLLYDRMNLVAFCEYEEINEGTHAFDVTEYITKIINFYDINMI